MSSPDSVFKIKNAEKEVLFTAETEDEVECCWWTGSKETTSMFIVKNTDHQEVFYVRRTFEPNGCFLTNSSTVSLFALTVACYCSFVLI